jgi:hypothetical protein
MDRQADRCMDGQIETQTYGWTDGRTTKQIAREIDILSMEPSLKRKAQYS